MHDTFPDCPCLRDGQTAIRILIHSYRVDDEARGGLGHDSFAKPPTIDDVSCPASIPVEVGREFECTVVGVGDGNSSGRAWGKVKIEDDQGDLSLG